GYLIYLVVLISALATLCKPIIFWKLSTWMSGPGAASWLKRSAIVIPTAEIFEYFFGVYIQVYLIAVCLAWIKGLSFSEGELFRFGWFLLIAALHYFFLITCDDIVLGAVADRPVGVIAWKIIYVGARGLITGWLLASWVCLFRQCETRRANQERWIQSEIQY